VDETQEIIKNGPKLKITRGWILRVSGSALILAVLLRFLPFQEVVEGFSKISILVFASVLGLFLTGHAVAAAKWWFLLERGFPYPAALRAHFAGLAANLCLPGVAGGDVVRAGLIAKLVEFSKLAAASLSDRLIDMFALVLVSASGLLMLSTNSGGGALVVQIGALFLCALIGVFYVFPVLMPKFLAAIPNLPFADGFLKLSEEFRKLGRRPLTLIGALSVSAAIQFAFVMLFIWLADVVGIDVDKGAWFFAWPLAKILAVLPISLGGLGLREATLAGLMIPFGAASAPVVATSLIWQSVLFVAGFIGAIAWLLTNQMSSGPSEMKKRSAP